MEYILTNALLALIEYPDTTLLSVNRLFSDKVYRSRVVDYIKDPAVKAFWTEEFANYTDRFAAEALPAIQNKIGQFTGNPLIRNIIGQPHSSFDIRKIMDEKKILIMNLSKGLVGETNANLLGSMLTTRIYLAAMSRADLSVEQMRTMPNFYFYVDEFQSFANATFANILSEARKYHLNLIIAHQYIEQMEEDVRNAVFGNVGTTIAFRVGPFDAEVLETVFSPRFLATDLVNLGFAQIYLTLMIDGIGSQPFSAITLPPVERPHVSCKDMVIAASRRNYTKPRDEVERIVADLHAPLKEEKTERREREPERERREVPRQGGENGRAGNDRRPREGVSGAERRPREGEVIADRRSDRPRPEIERNSDRKDHAGKRNHVDQGEKRPSRLEVSRGEVAKEIEGDMPRSERSLAELRAVLATLTAKETAAEEKEETKAVSAVQSGNGKSTEKKPGSPAHRQELASVLAQVAKPEPTQTDGKTLSSIPLATPALTVTPPPTDLSLETTTSPQPDISPDTVTAKVEIARMAAEAEAALRDLETNVSKPAVDDPLAPKKLERMLRAPGNERSPFTS